MRLTAALAAEVRLVVRLQAGRGESVLRREPEMNMPLAVEAALVEWGERLFYPGNRIVRGGAHAAPDRPHRRPTRRRGPRPARATVCGARRR